MKNPTFLRQETSDDFTAIFEVHQKAFGRDNEAQLVGHLRKNPALFIPELSIVATKNDLVVGHILFTKIDIKGNGGNLHKSLALAPMAVRPELQKRGIGARLVKKGLEVAKSLNFQSVIVLGHDRYYPKFGFRPAEQWEIKAPFDVPLKNFLAIELKENGLKNVTGTVMYPKEFQAV